MNPRSPREELKIRITTMLMGELPPDEAAALETQIAADAELTALHARLRRALGLLREATAIPEQPAPPVPARLSDERRARLLAHFQGAKPGPVVVKPRRDWKWAVPLGLAASLIALIGGALYVNGFGLRRSIVLEPPDFAVEDDDGVSTRAEFTGISAEKQREKLRLYRAGLSSKDLADSAVSMVKEQIRSAAAVKDDSRSHWASQPGMIRVYPSGEEGPKGGAAASTANAANAPGVSAANIDRARFFVEGHSGSPELNLFGRPRVATWPSGSGPTETAATTPSPARVAGGGGAVYLPPAAAGVAASDFDVGIGNFPDGPFAGRADAGVAKPFSTDGPPALDLFAMPVVEPYAISEPLSTDGKVTLPHSLAPFSWLESHQGGAVSAKLEPAARVAGLSEESIRAASNPLRGSRIAGGETKPGPAAPPPSEPPIMFTGGLARSAPVQSTDPFSRADTITANPAKLALRSAPEPAKPAALGVEISQANTKELSFDWMLGQSDIPGNSNGFTGGRTSQPPVEGIELPALQPGGAGRPALAEGGKKADTLDLNGDSSVVSRPSISGTAGLAKSGDGKLALSGTHAYTGGTTVTGGTLRTETAGASGPAAKQEAPPANPTPQGKLTLDSRFAQRGIIIPSRLKDVSNPDGTKPAAEENSASYKIEDESRVALGAVQKVPGFGANFESRYDGKAATPSQPATTSLGLVLDGLADASDKPLARSGDTRKNPTAGRGEVSEQLEAGRGIKGVKNETEGRWENRTGIPDTAFRITPTTPTAFEQRELPASVSSPVMFGSLAAVPSLGGDKGQLGEVRVDYGVPLKDTASPSSGSAKFQFNVGDKFETTAPGDGRKPALDPQLAEFNGFINFGSPIAAKPAGAPPAAQPALSGESGNRTRWFEVTRDGTLVNPAANATDGARKSDDNPVVGRIAVSDDNPVVGRIAFWGDDDTVKVNVNTAAGFVDPAGAAPAPKSTPPGTGVESGTVSGVVAGSGGVTLNKAGAGAWKFEGANTFNGGTTVNAGTPSVNPSNQQLPDGVNISGNTRTKDKVIRRDLAPVPGDLFDTVRNETALNGGTLSAGGSGVRDGNLPGVTTRSGQRASGETTSDFKYPAESPAPEVRERGVNWGGVVGSTEATVKRELARRMQREELAVEETAAGREALKQKDYDAAFAHFKNASETIPAGAPAVADSRKKAVEGVTAAGVKLAEQRANEGYYASAAQTLQEVLKHDPNSAEAQRLLSQIEAPDSFNKQVTPQHQAKVEDVKQLFIAAKGYSDLGRLDLADRKYQEILDKDPYNVAAYNGREEVALQKDRGARAGYNSTRALETWEVDKEWARPHRRFNTKVVEIKGNSPTSGPASSAKPAVSAQADGPGSKLADVELKLPGATRGADGPVGKAAKKPAPASQPAAPAEGRTDAQETFVEAFLSVKKAEEQEKAGDLQTAQATYRDAATKLEKIKKESPGWHKELVDFRVKLTAEAAKRVEQKLGEGRTAEAEKEEAKKKAGKPSEAKAAAPKPGDVGFDPVSHYTAKPREAEPPAPKPAPNPLVPQPEVRTGANAFSTFSLNVSDVAFKLAGASLERGVMPDVSTLRSEEFINAFDYRDPQPAAGAPLAFVSERARYPFAQNRDLLRLSVKTAAVGRQPGRPLNIVLLLDNSGSMERADRVRIVREAMRVLSAQLTPQDKLSIVTFARTPTLREDGVAGDKAREATARVGGITPEGGTNLAAALDLGYETALKHYQAGSINHVVILTDGAANLGNVDPAALKQKVEAHRKQGIALDCFGIGWEGLNDDMLEQLSRNGDGRYGFINTPEEAAVNFAGQLAGALRVAASDVKVQVEWNPKRVTAYRQVGYAKHQLTKEQFRDNTVDAAEIGAAESGNALYVVEVNPRGTGDLATVRVRFKVPGTSDYREQEWTVPFTGDAAPLEQASSTLRLAGTAAAFSEMLASSPHAAEVTSDRLLSLLNGVPAIYGADPRPKKLEWMIHQATSLSGR